MQDTKDAQPEISLLADPIDIYGAVRRIVLLNTPVSINIDDQNVAYQTQVTHAELNANCFYMDEVKPVGGNLALQNGSAFQLTCQQEGIRIQFQCQGDQKYDATYRQYEVPLPTELNYHQRRGAYRVQVPEAHLLAIRISGQEPAKQLTGRLVDLSETGFKAKFKDDVRFLIKDSLTNHLGSCSLRINENKHLDCSLECRHLSLDKNGNTTGGFIFQRLSPTAQRCIARLVIDFQWEEREQINQKRYKDALE